MLSYFTFHIFFSIKYWEDCLQPSNIIWTTTYRCMKSKTNVTEIHSSIEHSSVWLIIIAMISV